MKTALKINWVLTILLSISTGIFKVLQQQSDIDLFATIGINATATTVLGVIQLIGGVLLIPKKTRISAGWLLIPTFILASVAVFANDMLVFGLVSLLFIAMPYGVVYMEKASDQQ